jgi:two-component system response regulator YesN
MMKVLIADDEKKVCQLIEHFVDWEALEMHLIGFAHDGESVITLINETLPDIIITDIRMPGLNGLEIIKTIKKTHPHIEFIVISGFRQFEYAQEALKSGVSNYLLKPIDQQELSQTLTSIKRRKLGQASEIKQMESLIRETQKRKRKDFLLDLLQQDSPLPSIQSLNEIHHFNLKPGIFQLALIKFDGLDDSLPSNQPFADKIIYALEKHVNNCYDFECLYFKKRCVIFTNSETSMAESFNNVLEELLLDQECFNKIDITLAFTDGWESFQQLMTTLNQRLIVGANRVLTATYPQTTFNVQPFGKKLLQWVELNNLEAMVLELTRFKKDIQTHKDLSGDNLLDSLLGMFDYFLLGLKRFHPNYTPFPSLDKLDDFSSAMAVIDYVEDVVLSTFKTVLAFKEQEESKPITLAKTYINEHFTEPITLEEVAEIVGYSSSYFSTMFKEKAGLSFTEYVFDKRMEEAKRQLRDTNYTVAKICENVGYVDIKHFNKGFKKYTGITPKSYKKLYS